MNVSSVALEAIGWPVDPSALLRGFPALVSFAVIAPAAGAALFIAVADFDHLVVRQVAVLAFLARVVVVAHGSPRSKAPHGSRFLSITPVVGAAAAALAALIVEPILAKSVAADSTISGAAIKNDIAILPLEPPIGRV